MNIYIVRHGKTSYNDQGVYYGNLDCSLNEEGMIQGKALNSRLKHINFSKVYVSPKKRAKETLQIINPGCQVIEDGRITERSFGIFEGLSYKEIEKRYPIENKAWMEDWKGFTPKGGESFHDFYYRVRSFMEDIHKEKEDDILVVTHGGVMKAIYCYILDDNDELYWRFTSKNGDMALIKYEDQYMFIDSIVHID